jgi:haloalkane dehalogenase
LDDVVLIGHDWGGALAFDWAARHPERVRAVSFFETILRPLTWDDFPGPARPRLEALRAPVSGETKVLDENFFIEVSLRVTALTPLSDSDRAMYAAPYPTPDSRRPLLAWPRAFPIEGEPRDVDERVIAYDRWLATSEGVPKLLLTFDGPPELLIVGQAEVDWCRRNITNLQIAACGPAGHLAPEDQPAAIGRAIREWALTHGLFDARWTGGRSQPA